eukprot:SAG11_NODE_1921_length_4066_cov_4.386690_3_plen_129_part_00
MEMHTSTHATRPVMSVCGAALCLPPKLICGCRHGSRERFATFLARSAEQKYQAELKKRRPGATVVRESAEEAARNRGALVAADGTTVAVAAEAEGTKRVPLEFGPEFSRIKIVRAPAHRHATNYLWPV